MSEEDFNFIHEYAKCGIHHNHTEPEEHITRLNRVIDQVRNDSETKEAFAIRFAEWAIKEKWVWSYSREGWMQHHLPGEVKTKTTLELMEEFKKEKI